MAMGIVNYQDLNTFESGHIYPWHVCCEVVYIISSETIGTPIGTDKTSSSKYMTSFGASLHLLEQCDGGDLVRDLVSVSFQSEVTMADSMSVETVQCTRQTLEHVRGQRAHETTETRAMKLGWVVSCLGHLECWTA